jgi:hypothetical protein
MAKKIKFNQAEISRFISKFYDNWVNKIPIPNCKIKL